MQTHIKQSKMKMYPEDFVEWLLGYTQTDIDDDGYTPKWVVETETHVLDYFTTDEAYEYWKVEVRS